MNRICYMLLAAVCVIGLSILALGLTAGRSGRPTESFTDPMETKTSVAGRIHSDQALLDDVLESPERMDRPVARIRVDKASSPEPAVVQPSAYTDLSRRPPLMSSQEPASTEQRPREQNGTMCEAPPYVETFASLRADAVRNPESEQNQAAVRSIMEKRRRRLELRHAAGGNTEI